MDKTFEFEHLLNNVWANFPSGYKASSDEIAKLITAAQHAQTASGWMWSAFQSALVNHGGFSEKAAKAEIKKARIVADLGVYPASIRDFIPVWLRSRGYEMKFSQAFKRHGGDSFEDRAFLGNELKMWISEFKEYDKGVVEPAFDNWMTAERERIRSEMFAGLRYDPQIDPAQDELDKLVRTIIKPRATPAETERYYLAAKVSLASFIYRVKNHMRFRWKNSAHLMPILLGNQGDGKSETVKHLCSPLGDMFTSAGFDAFNDNSMTYQLSVIPVFLFEEMQGIGKTEIGKLKAIMTDNERQMREAYARAGVRRIITTFIACSNEDIAEKIRDSSGNRRFIQFETQPVKRRDIFNIDALKIWRSVDEDALEPPQYASEEITKLIAQIQFTQRYQNPVERWLLDTPAIPWGKGMKATELFRGNDQPTGNWGFSSYVQNTGSSIDMNIYKSAQKLGYALIELQRTGRFNIRIKSVSGSNVYFIEKPEVEEIEESDRDLATIEAHEREVSELEHVGLMADAFAEMDADQEQF